MPDIAGIAADAALVGETRRRVRQEIEDSRPGSPTGQSKPVLVTARRRPERLALVEIGGGIRRARRGEHSRSCTRDRHLALGNHAVPVVYGVQMSVDPAEILRLPIGVSDHKR